VKNFYGKALQAKRVRQLMDATEQEHPRDVNWEEVNEEIDKINLTVLDMELYEDD